MEDTGRDPFFQFYICESQWANNYYSESFYVCKSNFSIFCQYMTFWICFQYIWKSCVDTNDNDKMIKCYKWSPEHKPVVYKDVQVYLGKERPLNYDPNQKRFNKEGYVPAAQGSHQS